MNVTMQSNVLLYPTGKAASNEIYGQSTFICFEYYMKQSLCYRKVFVALK